MTCTIEISSWSGGGWAPDLGSLSHLGSLHTRLLPSALPSFHSSSCPYVSFEYLRVTVSKEP